MTHFAIPLSRSQSRSQSSFRDQKPMTRAEAYHLCHTPTISIPGGRIVDNPHYIGPPPSDPLPTVYVPERKPLSRFNSTSKEYQRTGVRSRPPPTPLGAPCKGSITKMNRGKGGSTTSTKSFVPIVSIDLSDSDDCASDSEVEGVRFLDTILEKEFDLEEEDTEEDVYSALCRRIQGERERKSSRLAVRILRKGKVRVKEVKRTAKDVWRAIY
ncbi:hypothetical protein L218DRAFT_951132 [Marasmius fiardii PR-910]|nr:hypothetical protein L218DRAFT_951132 [Marasmius fiardii PR-910]